MLLFRHSPSQWALGAALRSGLVLLVAVTASTATAQTPAQRVLTAGDMSGRAAAVAVPHAAAFTPPAWAAKLDASGRALALGGADGSAAARIAAPGGEDIATTRGADGRLYVDLFVQTAGSPSGLRGMADIEVRVVVGDISVVRVPVEAIESLARRDDVRSVEVSRTRPRLNDTGRADIRADVVHAGGGGLPRAFTGENVVVGVLDSGLDVTHPDFFNAGGSRVAFLLEFLQGGGQAEYTRAQITANPAAIPERDGNGGGGHGTHVTGSAAGSGNLNPAMRGVAPSADLIFVKGVRHPDSQGGFSDADVVAGADFVFQRAGQLGRPAVLNMSLGGHAGSPHDGSSLYEQALSGLTGAGRIIVAAAGNDGFNYIHAGENAPANVDNETLVFAGSPDFAAADLWYDAGTQNLFGIAAYSVSNGQLNFLHWMTVNAGQVLGNGGQAVPFVVGGTQIGSVYIDAATTQDPRNGDGHVQFYIVGGNGIDLRNVIWSIVSRGPQPSRIDSWAWGGAEFYGGTGVIPGGVNEMPGNTDMTIGTPSTSLGLLSIGSHTTNNDWVDLDGQYHQWLNPNPNGDPNAPPVVPAIGQRSYFSSRGPTRDGRILPHVTAPGEYIFSPLSSHVTVGSDQGVARGDVLQGGGYRGMQGTSMASPHATGVVALMLQADPSLTPAEARQILQETARTDGFTGSVPNVNFGAGKADALAAVLRTLQLCGSSCGGTNPGGPIAEVEPNNSIAQAQSIGGSSPITVNGQASQADVGELSVDYGGGDVDDFEDLFRVTTTGSGLTLQLSGFNRDLDLFLINPATNQIVATSNQIGETLPEAITQAALPAGTYVVAVSYYDGGGAGQSNYSLVATGTFAVDDEDAPGAGELALLPAYPNPARGAAEIAFQLPAAQDARVTVYDVLGREVAQLAEGPHTAGLHRLRLDASSLGAGIYVVRLVTGDEALTQRVVVTR